MCRIHLIMIFVLNSITSFVICKKTETVLVSVFYIHTRIRATSKKSETRRGGFQILVGVSGFEPEASWTRTKRDTKLRHAPIASLL